jgi:hypothetical protein
VPLKDRPLSLSEEAVLGELRLAGLDAALLHLTATGLEKAILDATDPIRETLRRGGVHRFDTQKQGQDHKVSVYAKFLTLGRFERRRVSLYRPNTKHGDPRLWITRLGEIAGPNDVIAIGCERSEMIIVNVTRWSNAPAEQLREHLSTSVRSQSSEAAELLTRLQRLSAVPIPATTVGDTAVGRAIETALGIQINSSKSPDFMGIELKSHREERAASRMTLFAQVPDWTASHRKSSREILDSYGYIRDGVRKLYCEVSTRKPNSQGLQLSVDIDAGLLAENHEIDGAVCQWRLATLHDRLRAKHRETFWIAAREIIIDGKTCFQLQSVRHTQAPSTMAFDRLASHGHITVDHLIKRRADGRVSEKGPLFKVADGHLESLFLGRPREYKLSG